MLVNFTSGVFRSEKEMELYQFRWSKCATNICHECAKKVLSDMPA